MNKNTGYSVYQRATSFISLLSLFLQITLPLTYAFPARAQEAVVEPTLVPTPEPTTVEQPAITTAPEPTIDPTIAPIQEPTVEPTLEISPTTALEASPTAEVSPTIAQEATSSPEITETPAITETPTVTQTPSENSSPAPTSEVQPTPTTTETPAMSMLTPTPEPTVTVIASIPTATVTPTEGHVDTTLVESYACRSDSLNGCLTSDKADYAPTDVALITGYGFLPNTQYVLHITSSDQPEVNFQSQITSNEQGSFSYSYQLDGTYRPNYSVNLADLSGVSIASTSFTDTAQGTIELKKIWSGTPSQVTLKIGTQENGSQVDSQQTGVNGAGPLTTGQNIVNTGTYYLSESNINNYDSSLNCYNDSNNNGVKDGNESTVQVNSQHDSVSVGNNQHILCTFTNTRNQGTVELKKVWSGTPGQATLRIGTVANGFDISNVTTGVNGGAPLTTTTKTVNTGTYYLSESGSLTNYNSSLACTDNGIPATIGASNSVTVNGGHTIICTFTNTAIQPKLTITKIVSGGNAKVSDFTLKANQTTLTSGVKTNLPVGTYTISETANSNGSGYTGSYLCDGQATNTITLALGDDKTCTITNTRDTGTVTVIKNLIPSNDSGLFNLKINGTTYKTNATDNSSTGEVSVITGPVTVSETNGSNSDLSDYTSTISCDNHQSHSGTSLTFTLNKGNDVICTITNTRKTGTIELKKIWQGTPSQVTLKIGTQENGSQVDSQQTGANGASPLATGQHIVNTGTYYLSETNLSNYDSDLTCFNDSDNDGHQDRHEFNVQIDSRHNSVSVDANDHILCTFTNTRNTGSIKVHKQVDNDGNGSFEITSDSSANNLGFQWGFDSIPENNNKNFGNSITIDTGTTSIYENSLTGYHFVGWFSNSQDHHEDHWKDEDKNKKSCTNPEGTTLPVPVSILKNKTTEITLCNARDLSVLRVYKFNDSNADGQVNSNDTYLPNWQIVTTSATGSTKTQITGDTGWTDYRLVAGTYTLSEIAPDESWLTSKIFCQNSNETETNGEMYQSQLSVELLPGTRTICYIGNYQKATITIQKDVVDFHGNEVSDKNTFSVSGGDSLGEKTFSEESSASFLVNPGTYTFSETNLDSKYTFKNINNCDGQILETGNITAESGGKYCLTFVNQKVEPILKISKTNNRPDSVSTGSEVQYTLTLTVSANDINDVVVVDLPPFGIKYKSGSFSATKNGVSFSIAEPVYSSPGKWYLGNLNMGDTIVLNYLATVDSYATPGIYKDLAYAFGCANDSESDCTTGNSDKVLALADIGKLSDNYVGTQVSILANSSSKDTNVIREEKISGSVLGATTSLPATGSNNLWFILSFALSLLGLSLLFIRKKMLNIFAILVIALALVSPSKTFAAQDVYIRLYEPKSPTILSQFPLDFTLIDQLQNRVLTVKCYVIKPDNSEVKLGDDISIKIGGNSGQCNMGNFSLSEDNKTYKFVAKVYDGANPLINSEEVSVLYDNKGPDTPSYQGKENVSLCHYKIKFKAANDGQTVEIRVYRSTETSFSANSTNQVASIGLSPDQEGSYTDNIPDNCNKDYYYAIRAFDASGNGSDVVGDTKTITVVTSTVSTGTVLGSQAGAIPVRGEVLGKKDDSMGKNAQPTLDPKTTTSPTETSGTVLGQQTVVHKITNTLGKLLIPALFVVGILLLGYGFKKRKEQN